MKNKIEKENRGNFILCIIIVAGYLFFLSSKMWLPDMGELIDPTSFYTKQRLDDDSVYLTKWDYAEADQTMEVVIEVESKDLLSSEFQCEAVERTSGKLHTKVVLKDADYMVVLITEIPDKWKEISLHIENKAKDTVNVYTNVSAVNRVAKLSARDMEGYLCDRLQGQIDYDTYQIQQKEKEISDLTKENQQLNDRAEELRSNKYPTQSEADDAADRVEEAERKIEGNTSTIEKNQDEIDELNTRTEELKKQIEELQ